MCGVGVWRWEGVQGCVEQIVGWVQGRYMTSVCVCVCGGGGGVVCGVCVCVHVHCVCVWGGGGGGGFSTSTIFYLKYVAKIA